MKIRSLLAAVLTIAVINTVQSNSIRAGVVISVGNTTLTTGGASQLVDVYGSWVAADGEFDSFPVDKFSFSFKILPANPNSSIVSFMAYDGIDTKGTPTTSDDTPTQHNGNHEQSATNYIFQGNSDNITRGLHTGVVSGANNDEYTGGDESASGLPFLLTSTPTLLFQLELFATGTVTTPEFFNLVVTSNSSGMSFLESPPLPFTAVGGEITVVSAADNLTPVPEPSTALIFATGVAAMFFRRKRIVSNHCARTSTRD